MVYLSLGQAAKEAGVSKATISKALKTGRLSYVSKSTRGYEIDPAELFRVFTPKTLVTVESERSQTLVETGKSQADVFELQLLRERVEDLQRDRDAWREQAQRLALTGPEQQPKKGWRLFGQR
jgi:DNA-binding XRE family transcriptional regulator